MINLFGKLIQKKSCDGAHDYTDRERWVLTNFAFLKSHIVRVASKQIWFPKYKLGCSTSSTVALQSDECYINANEEREEPSIDREIDDGNSQTICSLSTAFTHLKGKKTNKASKELAIRESRGQQGNEEKGDGAYQVFVQPTYNIC